MTAGALGDAKTLEVWGLRRAVDFSRVIFTSSAVVRGHDTSPGQPPRAEKASYTIQAGQKRA
jgi:hypothetical protein